jgi:DeoR/GlpR family transcriptional regulator of sugar metabolism
VDIIGALGRTDPVFADERKRHIAEYVAGRGRARIGELAELFAVTEQTIRKDLRALDSLGVLKRTYGGVLALQPIDRELTGRELTPATRAPAGKDAEQRIGRACVALLSSGDSVFLDSGTTGRRIARALSSRQQQPPPERLRSLTVLTNSPDVALEVADLPAIQHVLVGGQLQPHSGALIGPVAIQTLQQFTVDIAFVGVSGFSAGGLSVATVGDAEVKASIIERARQVVVPFDVTKAGATDFAGVCALDAVDTVVVDRATPEVDVLCASHGIRVVAAT